jgi:hypothetical protein
MWDCRFEMTLFEFGQAPIQSNAGKFRVQGDCLSVCRRSLWILLLAREHHTQARERFSIVRVATGNDKPGLLCFRKSALLRERNGVSRRRITGLSADRRASKQNDEHENYDRRWSGTDRRKCVAYRVQGETFLERIR